MLMVNSYAFIVEYVFMIVIEAFKKGSSMYLGRCITSHRLKSSLRHIVLMNYKLTHVCMKALSRRVFEKLLILE